MRKHFIRAICILGVLVVLVSCLPLSAFAVDPVSASVIANSFAQAIAAYGASNGVAMTFDVINTDGIGETVHELWSDFRAGTQDADDYDTLAAALFPDLYYKALTAAGTAAEAYTVGVRITSEYAEEFDNFYNWLLTGPAEMVQVDNQYYQFASSQIGPAASPISVVSLPSSFASSVLPYIPQGVYPTWEGVYSHARLLVDGTSFNGSSSWGTAVSQRNASSISYYSFGVIEPSTTSSSSYYQGYVVSTSPLYQVTVAQVSNNSYTGTTFGSPGSLDSSTQLYYYMAFGLVAEPSSTVVDFHVPLFSSLSDGLSAFSSFVVDPSVGGDSVGVKAYTNTGIADIPDTTDPNYDALGRAKDIPLGIPWDDLIYGDGTGALSDAQSGAIADEIAGVLETDSVIPLVEEEEAVNPRPDPGDDPSGDPDDYAVLGLEDVFPFCIPFDIYAFLSALAADPVPPSFTCSFDFPEALGGTQTLELDFDTPTFNQLAQLLRLLELLAFIVGLALLTRSMFIRG